MDTASGGEMSEEKEEDSSKNIGKNNSNSNNNNNDSKKSSSNDSVLSASTSVAARFSKQWLACLSIYLLGYYKLDPVITVPLVIAAALLFLLYQRKQKRGVAQTTTITTTTHYEDLPAWVVDPASKRAEWINKLLRHLWPTLSEAVDKKLRAAENDQELLRSIKLSKLSFNGTHLGSTPPKVTGIKVHSWPGSREVVADVGIRYDGGSAVVATAETLRFVPALNVKLDNLSFSGTLRLNLRPLLPRVPFFGKVAIGFVNNPNVDFDLGGAPGAALEMLPGLHLLIQRFVKEQINAKLVLPNKVEFNLANNNEEITQSQHNRVLAASTAPTDYYSSQTSGSAYVPELPSGVLSVHLVEAKSLVNKDSALLGQGKSDPYAKLTIVADGASHTFRSEVVKDCLDPVWRLMIDLPVDDPSTLEDLRAEVWDRDVASDDDFLGDCAVSASVCRTAMASGQTQDVWRKLEGVERGSIKMEVAWSKLQVERPVQQVLGGGDGYHQGVLSVLVDSCAHLLGGRTGLRAPSASARLELCGIAQVTDPPAAPTTTPVYAHRMVFLVRDPAADTLKVAVVDEKTGEEVGSLRLELSELLLRPNMQRGNCPYMLKQSKRRSDRGFRRDGGKQPCIFLSLAFRYLNRPKTTSFGVHRGLNELNQIMSATANMSSISENNNNNNNMEKEQEQKNTIRNDEYNNNNMETKLTNGEDQDSIPYIDQDEEDNDGGLRSVNTITPAPSPSSTAGERTLDISSHSANGALNASKSPPQASSTPFSSPGDQRPPARFDRRPRVLLSLKYSSHLSALSIVVHKAKNLQETPHTTVRPSPYVKLYAIEFVTPGGASRRVRDSKRKTKSQKGRVNPIFEETLTYFMPPHQLKRKRLELSVCSDRGFLGRNVVLGRCIVNLTGLHKALGKKENTATVTDWFHLSPTERELHDSFSQIRKSNTFGGSDKLPRKNPPKQSASAISLR